jgi:hypothetical protein
MHGRVRMKRNNDIANLKEVLRLPRLAYVDCAARQELKLALQRWPLLAELLAARGVEP